MTCTPEEPVPITATRRPLKSTSRPGQLPVWKLRPRNVSIPGTSTIFGADRQPVAMIANRAETTSPRSVVICHRAADSS